MWTDPKIPPCGGLKSAKTIIFERFRANFVAKQGGLVAKGGLVARITTDGVGWLAELSISTSPTDVNRKFSRENRKRLGVNRNQ